MLVIAGKYRGVPLDLENKRYHFVFIFRLLAILNIRTSRYVI